MTETTQIKETRPFNPSETINQIGLGNLFAISGGRRQIVTNSEGETVQLILPVGHGYSVRILLDWNDTYIVQRIYTRKGVVKVKGERTDVHFPELGDVAYYASCYVNVPFGEEKKNDSDN